MKYFWKSLFASFSFTIAACASGGNPNPPTTWGSYVSIFTTNTPTGTIQNTVNSVFATNGGQTPGDNGQFVNQGYAFLFAPGANSGVGTYNGLSVNIGYYTSIMGLGTSPNNVVINNVNSPQGNNDPNIGALNSFWRSGENFSTTPTGVWSSTALIGMTWAVSQAAPLRKVNVNGTLYLFQLTTPNYDSGYSSGGFMADCTVNQINTTQSAVVAGSQQQWITRNSTMTAGGQVAWSNGVWNQVFIGCDGAPASHCSNCPGTNIPPYDCTNCYSSSGCTTTCVGNPYTNIASTPTIAEKPFITATTDGSGNITGYNLVIPQAETNKVGTSQQNSSPVTTVSFTNVFVALPTDSVATINAQLSAGNHVVLTPGTYNLATPILISQPNLVLLGIGLPILIPTAGQACVVVQADGARVGGMILQAGPSTSPISPTLLQWGAQGGPSFTSGFLYDCYTRIGRFTTGDNTFNYANLMVQINSPNIVCDNLWLWRADHDATGLVVNGDNPCNTAFQANADNTTAYGLFCEHTLEDLCQWNGNNSSCYGFQSEFPYDATMSYQTNNYVGYRVNANVTSHVGYGIGVYSFFRDNVVMPFAGISAPNLSTIQFTNCLTRFLNGMGGIGSVLNGTLGVNTNTGSSAVTMQDPGPAYLCSFKGGTAFRLNRQRR